MPEEKSFLALLPLKNVVLLPKSIIPIIVGRQSSVKAVEYALSRDKLIFVSAQKSADVESPTQDDIYQYGTKGTILQAMKMPNNTLKILVEGLNRAKITDFIPQDEFIGVHYKDVKTKFLEKTVEIEAMWRQVQDLYAKYSKLNDQAPEDIITPTRTPEDIDNFADTIAVHLNLSFNDRQEFLEVASLKQRLTNITLLLSKEIEILETEQRIKGRIQQQVDKNQKEYYLTEQIKAIQKELGREDIQSEINVLRDKIKKLNLPADAAEKADKEIKRLEQMPSMSSEAVVSRNYLDWICSLPWNKASKDALSLTQAESILNKSHAGMSKAKERIIEFLATKKFTGSSEKSTIICLIGPPGVGKTSLAKTISNSLGREFVRISLGGVRDEAEIRGHRRTYIGALPGKIIQAMRKAKTVNPVILLDEIDKISSDAHGDPASALLEVLDPEQNNTFMDHYLDTEYDLSKVMFITTANHYDGIPYPLLDRMEMISLAGYTDLEKLDIAQKFLVPKKLAEFGLNKTQFKLNPELLKKIIYDYTKESGVRQLERIIAKLMRKTIQFLLKNKKNTSKPTIDEKTIIDWLGYPKYKKTSTDPNKNTIGITTGLAWTELGGDILEIEASVVPGKGSMTLTGQLGEVMQESAQAALSYIRSKVKELGLKPSFTANSDIHIHIPEGATPKDGPSAGITMCLALVSALTKNPVKPGLAMTGEITLRGRVLAIGGVKEKLLAAKRYDIKTVIVPKENYDDVQEITNDIGDGLKLIFVETMDEVLKAGLTKNPFELAKKLAAAKKTTKKKTTSKTKKETK
jgi:ATP-dependent Lon protease